MEHRVKIIAVTQTTRDTKKFTLDKPKDYTFIPGQATDLTINKPIWKEKKRQFSFASLNSEPYLEFIIKHYHVHGAVTQQIHTLKAGDELLIGDPWGSISYNGKGVFIAAGTGITPFISIFKQLKKENNLKDHTLLFSNKTQEDIIMERELREMFGKKSIFTLTRESKQGYEHGRIDLAFLKKHVSNFRQNFYLCGPWQFVIDTKKALDYLGVPPEKVVIEI